MRRSQSIRYLIGLLLVGSVLDAAPIRAQGMFHATTLDIVPAPNEVAALGRRELPPPKVRVSGRVTDSRSGEPIKSALVVLNGTTRRANSGDDGRYELVNVDSGSYTISVRRIGYAPKSQNITTTEAQTSVDFALEQAPSILEGVVTTATGETRKVEVGHAVAALSADSLVQTAPIRNLNELVGARVPGVVVNYNSGHTGVSAGIRIRGVSSVVTVGAFGTAKDPLIIIDGARVANTITQIAFNDGAGYGQSSGRFNDLPPEDIENIEIVKGPSAATLYGTDAANGVILITTKRGAAGRNRWSLHAESGFLDQPQGNMPSSFYSWGRNANTGAAQQCLIAQFAAGVCTIDSLTSYSPLKDKHTTSIGTGNRSSYGAQVSGGSTQLTYFLSGDLERETGVLKMPESEQIRIRDERGGTAIPDEQLRPNTMNKYSVRGNLRSDVGSTADVTLSTGFVRQEARLPSTSAGYSGAWWCPGYKSTVSGWCGGTSSPAPGESFSVRNEEDVSHLMGSLTGNWRPTSWLNARSTLGHDFSVALIDALQRNGEGPLGTNRQGRRQNTSTTNNLNTADVGLTAFFTLRPELTSKSAVGAQYNRRQQRITTARALGLPPGSETVTGAATLTSAEVNQENVVAGVYVEQTFGFRERLFVTGAVRADGGSSFGKNFNTAVYPKANISWLVSEESFMPRLPALSSLRLRAAYGASGVQPSSIAALPLEQLLTVYVGATNGSGAALSAVGNPDLQPEKRSEVEAGIDAAFFEDRVRFEGTYYNRRATNALIDRPLPASNGIATRQENLGTVRNWGWEGLLTAKLVDRPNFGLDAVLNGSLQHNRLESLPAGLTFVGIANPSARSRVGFPLYSRFDRLITSFKDLNGNGIIEPNEVTVTDTIAYGGNSSPTKLLTTTLSATLLRGRLRISSQFEYRGDVTQMNFNELNRCSFFANCQAANDPHADLWQQARLVARNDPSKGATWGGYFDDASFTRLRELSISATLPERFIRRSLRASSGVLTLSGRNLKVWTPYMMADPEVNSSPGLEYVDGPSDNPSAPASRYWIMRLTLHY